MLRSNNIIRYHRPSSKGFAATQRINCRPAHPPFHTLRMCGSVHTASTVLSFEACCCTADVPTTVATTYYSPNVVALRVSPEHMSRSAASTALEPEVCGCTH